MSSGKSENLHFIVLLLSRAYKVSAKGPYIKYVGGGTGGFLWGSRNILGIY